MGAKTINWDKKTFRQRLELLKCISHFETMHGWINADLMLTQAAKDVATLPWDQLGDRELAVFHRWGIEK